MSEIWWYCSQPVWLQRKQEQKRAPAHVSQENGRHPAERQAEPNSPGAVSDHRRHSFSNRV